MYPQLWKAPPPPPPPFVRPSLHSTLQTVELSASYTPEVSPFREAKVLSFDSQSKTVRLLLAESCRDRVQGDWDGVTPRRFELEDTTEGEEQHLLDPEAEFSLSELIDPRVLKEAPKINVT